ncbi:MAG TPA: AAA family ATPase, partial [Acidimicrobiales bacterium]|nr:AAA family ATPase [Acidimicrobiales bacterium]
MGLPSGATDATFVGRAEDLARLTHDLQDAAAHGFGVVLLSGDPGVGKTRLVTTVTASLPGEWRALTARAYPMGATASLAVWVEALDRHLRTLDSGLVKDLSVGVSDELAALLPAAATAVGYRAEREPPRLRILASLAVLLERLAARAPTLIHLDDAHLADGSSWEALSYFAHNLPSSPILVVAAARPAELAEHPAALEVLSTLEQEDLLVRRALQPLPPDAVAELARAFVGAPKTSDTLVQWLMNRAQGNPLYTTELLSALVEEAADLDQPALRKLPERLTSRVEARLAALSPPERTVIELLAVIGYRTPLEELEALCPMPAQELAAAVEHLVKRRLVDEQEDGRELSYEVAHPLIAEAVYSGIGGARRRTLHRDVARALVTANRPGAAAGHFARSAPVGDLEAVAALIAAFRQAESRELTREAMAILDGLLDLLPDGDSRWSDVFDAMRPAAPWIIDHRVDVGASTGTRAMIAIERVIERGPDKVRLALVKFNLASFDAWGSGDLGAARRRIEDAITLLREAGQHQMALLATNELGYLTGLEGNLEGHKVQAREVLADADAAGETFVALQALCSLALALLWGGELAPCFPYMDRALQIARDEQYLYRVTYVLALQGFAESLNAHADRSRALMAEAMAGNPAYRDTLLPDLRASSCWMHGDLADGAGWAVELSGWLTSGAVSRRRSFGAVFAAICLIEQGRIDRATHLLAQASKPFGGSRWWLYGHLLAWANAVLQWRTMRTPTALAELAAAAESVVAVGGSLLAPMVVTDLAEAAAESHDSTTALLASELQGRMQVPDTDVFVGLAAIVAAASAATNGRAAEAADDAEAAAAAFGRAGWQLWQGRALSLAGLSVAPTDRERALRDLGDAVGLLGAIGAVPRRDEAAAALASLERRGRKSAREAFAGAALTAREHEIATLAVEGLSAKEIASRLFIGN